MPELLGAYPHHPTPAAANAVPRDVIWPFSVVNAESPRLEPGQAAQQQQNQQVKVLAALTHQLVQDVGDDQDSYQQAFGTRSICLPAVTCRLATDSQHVDNDFKQISLLASMWNAFHVSKE